MALAQDPDLASLLADPCLQGLRARAAADRAALIKECDEGGGPADN